MDIDVLSQNSHGIEVRGKGDKIAALVFESLKKRHDPCSTVSS